MIHLTSASGLNKGFSLIFINSSILNCKSDYSNNNTVIKTCTETTHPNLSHREIIENAIIRDKATFVKTSGKHMASTELEIFLMPGVGSWKRYLKELQVEV